MGAVLLGVAIATTFLGGCAPRRPARTRVRACVDRADTHRRSCFERCEGMYEEQFIGCYGASSCTAQCQRDQVACQAGPLSELHRCGDAADDPNSCRSRLRADRDACAGRPDVAGCDADARRRAAACWRGCQRTQGSDLERCAHAFTTCLDGCVGG